MKTVRYGSTRLVVVTGNYLLPGWFILLGGAGTIHELLELFLGKEHITDLKSAIPLLVPALFFLIGFALFRRYTCSLDQLQQQATWKSMGLLGSKIRIIPLKQIKWADFEIDPNRFDNNHPKWGPPKRLVLVTDQGSLPFSDMYMSCGAKETQTCDAINDFLGRRPEALSPDQRAHALIAEGRIIEAIQLIRQHHGCSLAAAKDMVEKMR